MLRNLTSLGFLACLGACDTSLHPDVAVLTETYLTASDPVLNIDSVATHPGEDGITWLFATAKEGDVVRIYDASTGEAIKDLGVPGTELGQFQRPNGIVAIDGLLVVVERDNHRVQVFNLPKLEALAVFGAEDLVLPYGAYVQPIGEERYRLYVTDNYETADEQVPPENELDRRVHVYTLDVDRDAEGLARSITAAHVQTFGDTAGSGVLRIVESLWGDPVHDRLLVAEEDPAGGRVLKVYTLAGRFTGTIVGADIFRVQPEGIALYECPAGEGYWVTTDQDDGRNVFHVFDRRTLSHVGAFAGAVTRNTDGIWLTRKSLPGFPAGAFFAVHDDQAVAAFDWRAIAEALDLTPTCGATSHAPASSSVYRAAGLPDRIVLTPGADAAREMSVAYRTDAGQTAAEAEIAPALGGPSFAMQAASVMGSTRALVTENGPAQFHRVDFHGLRPDTVYAYRVKGSDGFSEWFQFRTAAAGFGPFRFVYVGDTQNRIRSLGSRVIRAALLASGSPALMLHAGDLVNQRNDSIYDDEWGEWMQTGGYAFASIPQLPIAGNHEYLDIESRSSEESKVLSPHWGLEFALPRNGPEATRDTTYHVDYQGVRFIALDGTAALELGAMEAQAAWIDSIAASHPAQWTIVSFHQPVYPCARADDGAEFRDEWEPLFRAHGVDLVLQGHDHCYARTSDLERGAASPTPRPLDGPVYVVSVAGAKMYRVNAVAHARADRVAEDTSLYQIIDVEAERLRFRAYTATGELYDAFDLLRDGDGRNLLIELPAGLPASRVCAEGIGPDGIMCLSRAR